MAEKGKYQVIRKADPECVELVENGPIFISKRVIDINVANANLFLATVCCSLLHAVKNPAEYVHSDIKDNVRNHSGEFSTAYRIEIDINGSQWRPKLYLESCIWFDYMLRAANSSEKCLKAVKYIQSQRDEDRKLKGEAVDYDQIMAAGTYCTFGTNPEKTCTSSSAKIVELTRGGRMLKVTECEKGFHSRIICKSKIMLKDNKSKMCGWYVDDTRHLNSLSNENYDEFLYFGRPQPVREIIAFPNPRDLPNWSGHYTSGELVCMPFLWECMINLSTLEDMQVEKIAVNFGEWETSINADSRMRDCHGHVHLWLSTECIQALADKWNEPFLSGRLQNPETYIEKNCRDLELYRLLSLQSQTMFNGMDELRNRMDGMGNRMDEMGNRMDEMGNRFTKVEDLLKVLIARTTPDAHESDVNSSSRDMVDLERGNPDDSGAATTTLEAAANK